MPKSENITRRRFVGAAVSAGMAASALLAGCSNPEAPTDGRVSGEAGSPRQGRSDEDGLAAQATTEGGGGMLFVNPSQDRNGNTAQMAADLLDGIEYETLNLIDYKIYPLGAQFDDDQFEEVWRRMCEADFLVWGTPVYWHTMSGALKVVVDRMYDKRDGELQGKPFAFFQQGGAPTEQALASSETIIGRIVELYGLDLVGTSDSAEQIPALREAITARL